MEKGQKTIVAAILGHHSRVNKYFRFIATLQCACFENKAGSDCILKLWPSKPGFI